MRGVEEVGHAARWMRGALAQEEEPAPPEVGTHVADYRLECRLGEGGQGTVYRARRGDQLFALKFLALSRKSWAWRELEVGLRLRSRGSLQVLGHGLWPAARPHYLYLVLPYVHGRPLPDWARQHNPSAREVVRILCELAWQVGDIHRAGVVHRDIKGTNVLIRHEDGRPVLMDFGVGTYAGALEITHPMALPGTPYYRSPEALRFRRGHVGEHSPARASDDLWALGVVLYVLLTGSHPFESLDPRSGEGALADLILSAPAEPPHERNPRVPRALSELCLRMLEKSFELRPQSAEEMVRALEAVLEGADDSWDAPLCETWSPEDATTPQEEALAIGAWLDKTRRLREYARRHERRGRPLPPEQASTLPRTPGAPPPGEEFPRIGAPRPRLRTALAGVLGGLLALMLAQVLSWHGVDVIPAAPTSKVTPGNQEVAPPSGSPDGVDRVAPTTTPSKDNLPVKTSPKAPAPRKQQQKPTSLLGGVAKACGTALTVGQLACTTAPATTPAAKPAVMDDTPPPAPCPAGAVENMKAMGLSPGAETTVLFHHEHNPQLRVIHQGDQFLLDYRWGKFPPNTFFSGPLIFTKDRVYARITQALIPGREPLPVCFELYNHTDSERGSPLEPGSGPGEPKVYSLLSLEAVDHFE